MTTLNTTISFPNIRITGTDKKYYINQFQQYAESIHDKFSNIKRVEFGKQDIRGGYSITLFNDKHTVPQQRHFSTKQELTGFVIGYNQATANVDYI